VEIEEHPAIREKLLILSEAAGEAASPQIRNAGTLAGNVCQRPWCWYYRNGFPCFKAGGNQCFSVAGENQFHAIFGGGPSYIVHPSDTAPALIALDAVFRIAGPAAVGLSTVPGRLFVVCNAVSAAVWAALFTFIGYHFGNALLAAIRPFFHVPHVGVELAVAIVATGLLWLARLKR